MKISRQTTAQNVEKFVAEMGRKEALEKATASIIPVISENSNNA